MLTSSMTNKKIFSALEIIAWIGTVLILAGYGLFSLGVFSNALPYHILNLLGSVAVAAISYRRKVWQPFVINACFALFAAVAIVRA